MWAKHLFGVVATLPYYLATRNVSNLGEATCSCAGSCGSASKSHDARVWRTLMVP